MTCRDINLYVGKFPAYEIIQTSDTNSIFHQELPKTWDIVERKDLAIAMIYEWVDHYDCVTIDIEKLESGDLSVIVTTEIIFADSGSVDTETYLLKVHHGKTTHS